MTAPLEGSRSVSGAPSLGLRVAAGLCAVVGLVSIAGAIALSRPLSGATTVGSFAFSSNLLAALLMCGAAVQTWRRRKSGALLVVLAWALPTGTSLLVGVSPRGPSLLMLLALVTLASNWGELQ